MRLKRAGHSSDASPLWRLMVRRTAAGKLPCEVFLDPHAHLCFRRALLAAIDAEPDNGELRQLAASLADQHDDIVRAIWVPTGRSRSAPPKRSSTRSGGCWATAPAC